MDFGLTDDKSFYDAAVKFRQDAIADGWTINPTYDGNESMWRASSLEKEGFKCSILTRTKDIGKWKYQAEVTIWGPDGLQILVPMVYDWEKIKAGLRRCRKCKKENVDTFRVNFAGGSVRIAYRANRKGLNIQDGQVEKRG